MEDDLSVLCHHKDGEDPLFSVNTPATSSDSDSHRSNSHTLAPEQEKLFNSKFVSSALIQFAHSTPLTSYLKVPLPSSALSLHGYG